MKMTAARATGLDFHAPLVRRDAWFPQDDTRARTYRAGRQFRGPGRVADDSVDLIYSIQPSVQAGARRSNACAPSVMRSTVTASVPGPPLPYLPARHVELPGRRRRLRDVPRSAGHGLPSGTQCDGQADVHPDWLCTENRV